MQHRTMAISTTQSWADKAGDNGAMLGLAQDRDGAAPVLKRHPEQGLYAALYPEQVGSEDCGQATLEATSHPAGVLSHLSSSIPSHWPTPLPRQGDDRCKLRCASSSQLLLKGVARRFKYRLSASFLNSFERHD